LKPTPTYQENYNVTFPTPWHAAFGDLTLDQNVDVDVANGEYNSFTGTLAVGTLQDASSPSFPGSSTSATQNVDVDVANGVVNSFEGEISIVTEQHG
jgi:hypothetical protein